MKFVASHLAEFVAGTRFETLPEPVVEAAERSILDTLASLLGGLDTENARLSRQAGRASFGSGSAPVWFTGASLHPLAALFANCAAASALDIDDGHRFAAGHPGAAIIPAVLAQAMALRSDGRDVLTATAVGYDVALRIAAARRFTDTMSFASGRWTGFGVAAGLGWLRKLPPDQIAHALAIAGAEAPRNLPQGDCQASSVKGSSPWSTVSASVATERAACGMTGSIDMLDRAHAYDVAAITGELGDKWPITETYLKPYAACRYVHPVIDAILALYDEDLAGHLPDRLIVEIFPEAGKLPNDRAPLSLESAQFSIPFAAALAVVGGAEAFRPMRPHALADPDVLALSGRVEVIYSQEFAGCFPGGIPARVTIASGRRERTKTVLIPLGSPENPMDRNAIDRKLSDLGRSLLSTDEIGQVAEGVGQLRSGRSEPLLTCLERFPRKLDPARSAV